MAMKSLIVAVYFAGSRSTCYSWWRAHHQVYPRKVLALSVDRTVAIVVVQALDQHFLSIHHIFVLFIPEIWPILQLYVSLQRQIGIICLDN